MATSGQIRVNALVKQTGWSRRHLIERVRREFGLTPKTLGRVLRLGQCGRGAQAATPRPGWPMSRPIAGTTTRPTSRATSVSSPG